MSKRKRTRSNSKMGLFVVVGLIVVTVAVIGYAILQQFSGDSAGLGNSQNAFTVSDHIGQPAPEFTAANVDGQPYTFKPGQGRPQAIVFYMGSG